MKKLLFIFIFSVFVISANAKEKSSDIVLKTPSISGGMPVLDAISNRRSGRMIANKEISPEHLSTLLWTAWGISSHDGKRVVPTARNKQEMDLYVATKDGIYLYDAKENKLLKKSDKDLRPIISGGQDFAKDAPVHLLFVSNDKKYGAFHAGSMYENASLYCASEKLQCVVRAMFDSNSLSKDIGLTDGNEVLITLAVGYLKK